MTIVEKALVAKLKKMFLSDFSGHDAEHLIRVCNIALQIQKKEGGDRVVIGAAALLHDTHRLLEGKTGKFCHPRDSLDDVRSILDKVGLDKKHIDKVLHCVEFHEEYSFSTKGNPVKDVETLVLQDADNLDAIGAVGIARAFAFGGANNIPIWIPDEPFKRQHYEESAIDCSGIHHFYTKLLKLKNNMNTGTGKQIATKRHEFMKSYLDHFFKEWSGDI